MKIGITFAIYNNWKYTERCLDSIFKNNSKNEVFVVVVDNNSNDGSYENLKKYRNIKVIKNSENLSCAIAWNQGIDECKKNKCDYVILTQNDLIVSENTIDNCVNFLEENSDISIVSPECINIPSNSVKELMSQERLNEIYNKAKIMWEDNIGDSFCFYFFCMKGNVFNNFRFDEKFRKPLYEDHDFYNQLNVGRVVSCRKISCGLVYHTFSATQNIVKNPEISKNNIYFHEKWSGEMKQKSMEGGAWVRSRIGAKIRYPLNSHYGLDYESIGL